MDVYQRGCDCKAGSLAFERRHFLQFTAALLTLVYVEPDKAKLQGRVGETARDGGGCGEFYSLVDWGNFENVY